MTLFRGAFVAALLALTLASSAALSPKYREWGDGPIQWIMTDDEHRQWKQIQTDDDAEQFIELFWARRDPTPGTPANEFKADFEARVEAADKQFPVLDAANHVIGRGAMSDRGRTLIVIGRPDSVRHGYLHHHGAGLTSQAQGKVEIWSWGKAGNPPAQRPHEPTGSHFESGARMEFIEDERGICCVRRDPRDLLSAAAPSFIRKTIVNPSLTTVPDWAKPQSAVAAAPALPPDTPVRKLDPGVRQLLLLKDLDAIVLSDHSDPFVGVASSPSFAKSDELGYVAEYCGQRDPVKVSVAITGTAGKKKLDVNTAPGDAHPIPIATDPGCGMIRGAIPLSRTPLVPGSFTFTIKLDDGPQSYNLSQQFRIE